MKKIFMTLYLIAGLFTFFSCSNDSSSYPVPTDIENVKATPGPGEITLSWTVPADSNLYYVQVEYTIEATGKSYKKLVSKYADKLLISNLLKKYGEISFNLQVFNKDNTAGATHQLVAQSDKANPTFGTPEKMDLKNNARLWTNAPFPTRKIDYLVDGTTTSFFHTQWQTTVNLPHYVVIDLGEEVSAFNFRSINTNRPADSAWENINIYTSDSYDPNTWFDGVKFVNGDGIDISEAGTHLETALTDLPDGVDATYTSEIIPLSKPSRYLWFEVTKTTKDLPYFAEAELEIYKYSMVTLE